MISSQKLDSDRKGFIIKTYTIIFLMLLVTSVIGALVYSVPEMRLFALKNQWLFYVCLVFVFFIMCYISCLYKFLRQVPLNYVILSVFTLAQSWVVAVITA